VTKDTALFLRRTLAEMDCGQLDLRALFLKYSGTIAIRCYMKQLTPASKLSVRKVSLSERCHRQRGVTVREEASVGQIGP
jgi:hypothetical protein